MFTNMVSYKPCGGLTSSKHVFWFIGQSVRVGKQLRAEDRDTTTHPTTTMQVKTSIKEHLHQYTTAM